jgi:hypothetical protein
LICSFGKFCFSFVINIGKTRTHQKKEDNENYNSKREDLEEEDQGEDERNVIL